MMNLLLAGVMSLFLSAPTSRSVLDGVYTTEQAARGESTFAAHCKMCHRSDLLSSPEALALRGPSFVERWREDSLQSLFNKMSGYMPPRNVSPRLQDQEYLDIIAFVLEVNDYPAGSGELKADQLSDIQLVDKDGPKPLPNLAQVAVTGCLNAGPNDTWLLNQASDPVRTRMPDQSTPEELKAAAARPAGSQTLRLRVTDTLSSELNLEPFKGQRVLVKGVLSRQQAGDRINVLSIGLVSAACGN